MFLGGSSFGIIFFGEEWLLFFAFFIASSKVKSGSVKSFLTYLSFTNLLMNSTELLSLGFLCLLLLTASCQHLLSRTTNNCLELCCLLEHIRPNLGSKYPVELI